MIINNRNTFFLLLNKPPPKKLETSIVPSTDAITRRIASLSFRFHINLRVSACECVNDEINPA